MIPPNTLSWIVGVAIVIVGIYVLIRMWRQDKARRDEAEFIEAMLKDVNVIENGSHGDDPAERPIGV